MSNRKRTPQAIETEVLTKSRRRCCLCVFLNVDCEEKPGQIAHIDHNPANSDFDNLVWLCLEHHDRYDSTTSQSKKISARELKEYRNRLYDTDGIVSESVTDGLNVRISPSIDGRRVGICFHLENASQRPIRVVSWLISWKLGDAGGASERAHPSLPVILGERDEHRFWVDADSTSCLNVDVIGVRDSDRRLWKVSDSQLLLLRSTANRNELTKHLLPDDHSPIPEDASGQSVSIEFVTRPSRTENYLGLVAIVKNTGDHAIPILGGAIEWKYTPPRSVSECSSESGGSIEVPSPIGSNLLEPGCITEFVIDDEMTSLLVNAAAVDVKPGGVEFGIQTSRVAGWCEREGGLAAAVEKVARSVMAARHGGEQRSFRS